jgi:hypothetical protein
LLISWSVSRENSNRNLRNRRRDAYDYIDHYIDPLTIRFPACLAIQP